MEIVFKLGSHLQAICSFINFMYLTSCSQSLCIEEAKNWESCVCFHADCHVILSKDPVILQLVNLIKSYRDLIFNWKWGWCSTRESYGYRLG